MEGKNVYVRTVTYHYTGRVLDLGDVWLRLTDVAWVADSGRWHTAITEGSLAEVEPYPDGHEVLIPLGAIVEITEWPHALPRKLI